VGNRLCIIINADDLGLSEEVNSAIFELMAQGKVTSATMLANGPAVAEAVARVREFPGCSFGVHLNLTEFKPITASSGLAPLLNEAGEFAGDRIREIKVRAPLREAIYREWCAQIERLRALGVQPTHIDSHHHVHTIPALFGTLKAVQRQSGIRRVRNTLNLYSQSETKSWMFLLKKRLWSFSLKTCYSTRTTEVLTRLRPFIEAGRAGLIRCQSLELMTHPGSPGYADELALLGTDWCRCLPLTVELISYHEV